MGIFSKKTWLARLGTNLNRFTDTATSNVMMLENTPTTVTQDGDSFNTENMNGLEDRVDTAIETVNAKAVSAQSTADTGVTNAATAQARADSAYTLAGTKVVSVNGRTGAVEGLAEDNDVIHNTGNETIGGNKEFTSGIEADKGVFATGFSQDSLPSDTEGIALFRNTSLGVNRIASFIKSALGALTYTGLAIGAYIDGKFQAKFNADGTVNFNFRTTSPSIPRCTYQATLTTETSSIAIANRNNGETGAINCRKAEIHIYIPTNSLPTATKKYVYLNVNNITTATYKSSSSGSLSPNIPIGHFMTAYGQVDVDLTVLNNVMSAKSWTSASDNTTNSGLNYGGIHSNIGTDKIYQILLTSNYPLPIGTTISIIETEIL